LLQLLFRHAALTTQNTTIMAVRHSTPAPVTSRLQLRVSVWWAEPAAMTPAATAAVRAAAGVDLLLPLLPLVDTKQLLLHLVGLDGSGCLCKQDAEAHGNAGHGYPGR